MFINTDSINRMAAFQEMAHVSPVKHSDELLPRQYDYRTHRWTDGLTDTCWTKWSLHVRATMPCRQHKKECKQNTTFLHASIWWYMIGNPATGNKGFGNSNDKGRNLVPGKETYYLEYTCLKPCTGALRK